MMFVENDHLGGEKGTLHVNDLRAASGFDIRVGDADLVASAGLDSLASIADNTGLTRSLSEATPPAGERAYDGRPLQIA